MTNPKQSAPEGVEPPRDEHGHHRQVDWPLVDDIRRAVYADPKAAALYGESPKVVEARELAESTRNGEDPVTFLPDGTPATNAEAIAFNDAQAAKVKAAAVGHAERSPERVDTAVASAPAGAHKQPVNTPKTT